MGQKQARGGFDGVCKDDTFGESGRMEDRFDERDFMTGSTVERNTKAGHKVEKDGVRVAFNSVVWRNIGQKGAEFTYLLDDYGEVKRVDSSGVCGLDSRNEKRKVRGLGGEDMDGLRV